MLFSSRCQKSIVQMLLRILLSIKKHLMAHVSISKGGVKNRMLYTVSEIKAKYQSKNQDISKRSRNRQIRNISETDDNMYDNMDKSSVHDQDLLVSFECGLTLPFKTVAKSFCSTHALTIPSSQGRTLPRVVEIRAKHKRFTMRHLMLCLSRGVYAKDIQVR